LKKKSAFIENNLIIAGMVKVSQYSLNKILVSLGVLLKCGLLVKEIMVAS